MTDEPDKPDVELVGEQWQVLDSAVQMAIRESVQACVAWSELYLFGSDDPDEEAQASVALVLAHMAWRNVLQNPPAGEVPKVLVDVRREAGEFFDGIPEFESPDCIEAQRLVARLVELSGDWRDRIERMHLRMLHNATRNKRSRSKALRRLAAFKDGRATVEYVAELEHAQKRKRLGTLIATAAVVVGGGAQPS